MATKAATRAARGELTHLDAARRPHMVEVGEKPDTLREAVAKGEVSMQPETLALIRAQGAWGQEPGAVSVLTPPPVGAPSPAELSPPTRGPRGSGNEARSDPALTKGDVLAVAQVAGIMAAKQTPQLIPMCHPIAITGAQLGFELDESRSRLLITAIVRTVAKTGVEMEALTAVAVAGLTVYDMCKAVDKTMRLEHVRLVYKRGGRSGTYEADT